MLHLRLSQRVEELATALVEVVRPPLAQPFANDCIVVQSRGMQRWLEMTLASATGVWANGWFPFPDAFLRKLRRDVCGAEAQAPYDRDGLAFAVAAAIAAAGDEPAFAPLRRYLGASAGPAPAASSRLLPLARRVADVFDGYALHRPDVLLAWEAGDVAAGSLDADDAWQPALWRAIVAAQPERSRGVRQTEALIAALEGGKEPQDPDFERVCVFGLSALSPLYVRVLAALGRHREVHVFALAPSPAEAEALRQHLAVGRLAAGRAPDAAAARAVPPPRHPLLRSMGGVARDFQLVAGAAAGRVAIAPVDAAATPSTALAALQADLAADAPSPRPAVVAALVDGRDASISVHACHGPLREVEVLRDQLVAAFDADRTLAPHDVVVLTPDIAGYAPYVEAVLGATRLDGCRLPFSIADRRGRDALPVAQAFGRLLHVLRGRFPASEVVDLLSLGPVQARFGLEPADVELVRRWVAASGVRWAADAEHRRAVGQPADGGHTWRFGLDRLALGAAVGEPDDGGAGDGLFAGALPAVEALTDPRVLGGLAAFVDRLDAARHGCLAPRSARAWADTLAALLADLIAQDGAHAAQQGQLRTALDDLARRAEDGGFAGDLTLDSVTDLVLQAVDGAEADGGRGFLAGGITVAALSPMRSIPFRVVALLGLNDGDFPRAGRPFAFDLAARQPRLGDRRPRDDDRFLFLEALLAARDRLIVTYSGQSARDNSRRPPSVVVSELLDALVAMDPAATTADPAAAADRLVTWHPLQPFSPRYFAAPDDPAHGDPRLFSYAGSYAGAAAALGADRAAPRPFFGAWTTPLAGRPPDRAPAAPSATPPADTARADGGGPDDGGHVVALADLAGFFRHPARHVLRRVYQVELPSDEAPLVDREPLELDGLGRHAVGEAVLVDLVAGRTPAAAAARARARGLVPLGTPGVVALRSIVTQAHAIAERAAPWLAAPPDPPVRVDLPLPGVGARLVGTLAEVRGGGVVRCSFARVDPGRSLDVWIEHLALCAAGDAGAAASPAGRAADGGPVSRRFGRPVGNQDRDVVGELAFGPVADARRVLETLVALYLAGRSGGLPFLPRASHAYAAADATGRDDDAAWRDARTAFEGSWGDGGRGEGGDAWVRLALGDAEPFGPDGDPGWRDAFAAVAHAVYDPLRAALAAAEAAA